LSVNIGGLKNFALKISAAPNKEKRTKKNVDFSLRVCYNTDNYKTPLMDFVMWLG